LQLSHSISEIGETRSRSVAPEVGHRSGGCASPAARADDAAVLIWPHDIGCPQRRECEWVSGGVPTEAGPGKYVGISKVRARVPERRYWRQRIRRPDAGHQQCETAGDATDRRG